MVPAGERSNPVVGEPLPRADIAVAPPTRFSNYILSPSHPKGMHKARVFSRLLGLELEDAGYLRRAILEGLKTSAVLAVREGHGEDTWNCEVEILVLGKNGITLPVTTAWEATLPPKPPRLLTAYLKL